MFTNNMKHNLNQGNGNELNNLNMPKNTARAILGKRIKTSHDFLN